jgi:predicted ATPase
LTILASSREALAIAGEQAIRVRSLSLPVGDARFSAAELAEFDAIRLFVSRAKAVKSSFSLTDENAMAVAQICRRLDGIPLAIELAAARARVLTPEQILDRLDDRFRLLTGGSRTALPRQRTLQALIDWSYELLSELERVLLGRLSVFSGGWTLEAAESVTGTEPIEPYELLDLSEQLVNKSLILAKETDLGMRYRMLETIRQYAQEKLAQSGEADQLRDRHLVYFVEQQEQGARAMMALRGANWIEKIAADHDNLRAAREWALESDTNSALRLMAGLTPRWSLIISPAEGMQYIYKLLEQAESLPEYTGPEATIENKSLFGQVLLSAAAMALSLGLVETMDYADRGAAIARELGDVTGQVWALSVAASRSGGMSDAQKVSQYHQELYSVLPEMEPNWIKALVMTSFGINFAVAAGKSVEQAWKDWETGMAMFRQGGEFWGLAFGHNMAAIASYNSGDLEKAQQHAERAIGLYTELGENALINSTRSLIADVARQRGDLDRAEHAYSEAIAGWRNINAYGGMSRCLECLAFVYNKRAQSAGDDIGISWLVRAATLLGAAAAIRQSNNTPMVAREQVEYDEELALIQAAAGKSDFKEGWQRGQAMDPDEAVAFGRAL